jgi:hypothetical protein
METQEVGEVQIEKEKPKIVKTLSRLVSVFLPSASDVDSVESMEARIERQRRLREHMQNLWLRR